MIRRTWSGAAAKGARLEREMKPEAVAEELGVDRSSIYGWEAGREPMLRHVLALAALYAVPVESLFHEADGTAADSATPESHDVSPANADAPMAVSAGAPNTGGHEGAPTQE